MTQIVCDKGDNVLIEGIIIRLGFINPNLWAFKKLLNRSAFVNNVMYNFWLEEETQCKQSCKYMFKMFNVILNDSKTIYYYVKNKTRPVQITGWLKSASESERLNIFNHWRLSEKTWHIDTLVQETLVS